MDSREGIAALAVAFSYGILVRHEGDIGAGAKLCLKGKGSSFLFGSTHKCVEVSIKSIVARERGFELEYLARDTAALWIVKFRDIVRNENMLHHVCGESCFVHSSSILLD